eukprot:TRINITY_DN189_c0_g1_i5.p1 TRINITY_DN189_c0_g1~~TRINITY_DN189_c0_g1_i5.p1  ORF type:complete len:308 (-),score=39.06 TRINITY_DN189_c0_g1_i5:1626-2549(-)
MLFFVIFLQLWSVAHTQDGCVDIAPASDFTCQQQATWKKCSQEWMLAGDYCRKSCGRCAPSSGLDCSLATTLECDRLALLEMKAGMSKQAQAQLTSWSSANPCSGWKGIYCRMVVIGNSEGLRVNRIRLGEYIWQETFGVWSSSKNLDYVPNIDMQFPKIIPQNMKYVEEISLWNCGITGQLPLEVSKLSDLQVFTMGENNMQGTLPAQFSTLGDVKVMQLQGMGLTGSVPPQYSTWSQIRSFNIRFNDMQDIIPVEYSKWVSGSRPVYLQSFFVQQNGLCTDQNQISTFTKRAALSTDIQLLKNCN